MQGFKFRRQQPIGNFVVDFYCDEGALIVEVDGPIHAFQQEADRERQGILESLDLRVLRITADVVTSNIESALALIGEALPEKPLPLSLGSLSSSEAKQEGSGVRAAGGE